VHEDDSLNVAEGLFSQEMQPSFSPIFDPASPQAAAISDLFIVVLVICGVILAIVIGMVGGGLMRFRQRPGSTEPPSFFGNRKLEIIWTVGPALIVFWLFVLTARGMRQADPPENQPPDLIVISHQWWWEARYPHTGVVTANEIHIPAGSKWLARLESADVIHDFWVPRLGPKMDVVPGMTNHIWLEATAPGSYAGTCAEYCGAQHSWMRFSVIAESPAAFAAWLQAQDNPAAIPATDSARQGLKIFQAMTCINCHSIGGVSVAASAAPNLTHLASRERLGAGVLANTETNLFRWLKNPQAIKPACLMPDLKLTDAQAGALASYLATLK
jgi:cytochrome c oxidase subunit II